MHVAFYSYKTHTTEGLILGLEIYAEDIPIQGLILETLSEEVLDNEQGEEALEEEGVFISTFTYL